MTPFCILHFIKMNAFSLPVLTSSENRAHYIHTHTQGIKWANREICSGKMNHVNKTYKAKKHGMPWMRMHNQASVAARSEIGHSNNNKWLRIAQALQRLKLIRLCLNWRSNPLLNQLVRISFSLKFTGSPIYRSTEAEVDFCIMFYYHRV